MARSAAVIKPSGIAPFIIASMIRRTAIMAICDSNGDQATNTGHNIGMRQGASYALGCYGTGVLPCNGGAGYQAGVLQARSGGSNGLTNAPSEFSALSFPASSPAPCTFEWFDAGWAGNNGSHQMPVEMLHPMDLNRGLRLHLRLWRPASGGITTLNPCVIATNSNYGQGIAGVIYPGASAPIALPPVPANGITDFSWSIPAGSLVDYADPTSPLGDGGGFSFRFQRYLGPDIAGQFGAMYEQLEDSELYRGIQWSKFYVKGGAPSLDCAIDVCNVFTDAMLAEWFRAHAVVQVDANRNPLPPIMLVHLLMAGNDAGNAAASCTYRRGAGFGGGVTSGNALGNTAQGIENNQQAIINRLRDVWVNTCGYSEDNLYFLLGCNHPQPPATAQFTFVRTLAVQAWAAMCEKNQNVSCVDGYKLHTHETFDFRHPASTWQAANPYIVLNTSPLYREPGIDNAHLQHLGYLHWGQITWRAIMDSALDQNATNPAVKMRVVNTLDGRTLIDRR